MKINLDVSTAIRQKIVDCLLLDDITVSGTSGRHCNI